MVNWNRRRIISLDYRTGEVYWTIGPRAFGIDSEPFAIEGPRVTAEGNLLVEIRDGKVYEVDRCGEATARTDLPSRWAFQVGNFSVVWSPESYLLIGKGADDLTRLNLQCEHLVSSTATSVICLTEDSANRELSIRDVDLDTKSVTSTMRITDLRGEGELYKPMPYAIAISNNELVTSFTMRPEQTSEEFNSVFRRIVAISLDSGERGEFIDLGSSTDFLGQREDMMPVWLPGGQIIVGSWGRLYGISTSL